MQKWSNFCVNNKQKKEKKVLKLSLKVKSAIVLYHSTVVLYIGIMKVWDLLPQNITPKPA